MSSGFGEMAIEDHYDPWLDENEHAFSNPPYFSFRQDFNDGTYFEGVSYGGSRFTHVWDLIDDTFEPVFSVHKTHDPPNITMSIQSERLAEVLKPSGLDRSRKYDVLPIFEYFTALHTTFQDCKRGFEEAHWPDVIRELKLFVVDFLLDEAIFSDLYDNGSGYISPATWGLMQQRKALLDLDSFEDALDHSEMPTATSCEKLPHASHQPKWEWPLNNSDDPFSHLKSSTQDEDRTPGATCSGWSSDPCSENCIPSHIDHNNSFADSVTDAVATQLKIQRCLSEFSTPKPTSPSSYLQLFSQLECASEFWHHSTFEAEKVVDEVAPTPRRLVAPKATESMPDLATYLAQSDRESLAEDRRRWQLVSSFRKHFHKSFSTLKQRRTSNAMSPSYREVNELSRLQIPPDPRSAWKDGIRVVRGLLRGRLPQTVEQVIFCIMTAKAMRVESDRLTIRSIRHHLDIIWNIVREEDFVRDLYRWRDIVPVKDRRLFEQTVHLLWGAQLDKTRRAYHTDNLFHFQELFQNLLSEMNVEEIESNWFRGTRLSVIQARHAEGSESSSGTFTTGQPSSVSSPDTDMPSHRSEIYKANWNAHEFKVIELVSTVIFFLVIAAFLFLYHPRAHAQATFLMQKIPCEGSELSIVHHRNCILLACYLGLSTHTIEKIPFTDGANPKTLRPCCLCGERGTKSNMKRHMDKHNNEKKYGCQYCTHEFSRKDNRDAHEKNCSMRGLANMVPTVPQDVSSSIVDWPANAGPTAAREYFDPTMSGSEIMPFTGPSNFDCTILGSFMPRQPITAPMQPSLPIDPSAMDIDGSGNLFLGEQQLFVPMQDPVSFGWTDNGIGQWAMDQDFAGFGNAL